MKLKILFGLRRERYAGQHAPEALAVVDEYSHDANPDWLWEQKSKYESYSDFVAVRVMEVEVDQDTVREHLVGIPELDASLEVER